jgi:hypothetical protein
LRTSPQKLISVLARNATDRRERADPEDFADNRGVLQQPFLDIR